MIKRTATVLTMIAALATTAVAWAGPVSASSSQDDDDLPRFGPGNQYRPVIEAKDFSPNVTNRWLPLEATGVRGESGVAPVVGDPPRLKLRPAYFGENLPSESMA